MCGYTCRPATWHSYFQSSLHWDLIQLRNGARISEAAFQSSLHWDLHRVKYWQCHAVGLSILFTLRCGACVPPVLPFQVSIFQSSLHWDVNCRVNCHVSTGLSFNPLYIEIYWGWACNGGGRLPSFNPLYIEIIQAYIRKGRAETRDFQSSLHWDLTPSEDYWWAGRLAFNPLYIEATRSYWYRVLQGGLPFNPLYIEICCLIWKSLGNVATFNPLYIEIPWQCRCSIATWWPLSILFTLRSRPSSGEPWRHSSSTFNPLYIEIRNDGTQNPRWILQRFQSSLHWDRLWRKNNTVATVSPFNPLYIEMGAVPISFFCSKIQLFQSSLHWDEVLTLVFLMMTIRRLSILFTLRFQQP